MLDKPSEIRPPARAFRLVSRAASGAGSARGRPLRPSAGLPRRPLRAGSRSRGGRGVPQFPRRDRGASADPILLRSSASRSTFPRRSRRRTSSSSARSTFASSRSPPSFRSSTATSRAFARWIGSIAWLLREHWEGAHPRAEGSDYSARLGQLMALEDNAVVLLPLQYARLLETSARRRVLLPRPAGGDRRRPAAVGHPLQRKGREGDERRRKVRARRRRSTRFCATSRSKSSRPWSRRCVAFRRRSNRSRRPRSSMSATRRRSNCRSSTSSSAR